MRKAAFLPVLLLCLSPLREAVADSRALRAGEGDGASCGLAEGPETLAARYQWYVETFGANGVFDPQRHLERTREAYAAYLRERAHPSPLALEPGAFRFLGPTNGAGRTPAIEPHPTDPEIVYAGAAGGGCWKSTDAGTTWRALTDGLGDLSVGAVALAPSNPSIVYLGTGEGGYSTDFVPGIGIFRSTDAGETWRVPPFVVAPLIYRISVDPRNADVLVAFTNQGAQRSTDGGLSFRRTSDVSWGDAADVARDGTNPDVLHGTFWGFGATEIGKYARSTDGGSTWTEVRTGLPPDPKGRMSIALSADGRTLYSLVSGTSASRTQAGLYRSTNAGASWTAARLADAQTSLVPDILAGQGSYDNTVAVDPDDARTLLIGGGAAGHYRSTDGGDTVLNVGRADRVHVDVHQLLFRRYGSLKVAWSGNDGGVWRSTDGGVRWQSKNEGLATRQYYSVAIDATRPSVHYGGTQDNGTDRRGDDTTVFAAATGGDGFETAVDPASPGTIYTTGQFSTIFRSTNDGGANSFGYLSQSFAGQAFSRNGGDRVKPFFTRITLDPNDPRTLYTGTYRVWRSEDRGETWTPLGSSAFTGGTEIRAIAVARGRPERILAAQRSELFLSNDGGQTFARLPFVPSGGFFNVEIDPSNPDVFWASSAFFGPSRPGGVYVSTNAGASWTRRSAGLPDFAVPVVRVDPTDSRTVYAGTLAGLYRSTDGGLGWARFGEGLPAVAIFDVRLTPDGSRIAVATHGRGLWTAQAPLANRAPDVAIEAPAGAVTIAAGASVSFTGAASDPDGDAIAALRWDLGDGMTATTRATGPIVYRTPGVYRVSLVADDAKGARGAAFVTVVVIAPNDACANATPIALLPDVMVDVRTGNGGAAATDRADPATCSDPEISSSVWFVLTPPADGTLELDTFGSLGDTILALYEGSCAAPGPALDCNDDAPDVSGGPSKLKTLPVTAGRTYRLLVASWADAARGFTGPVDGIRVRALFIPSDGGNTSDTTALLPVVLDAFGRNGARFTSDLTLLNRGAAPLTVALTYGGPVPPTGDVATSLTLAGGEEVHVPDALAELRRAGIGVPKTTPSAGQVGSLTALVTGGDPDGLVLASRIVTPNPNASVGGTFGTFAAGTTFAEAAENGAVYVFGLRQTERDRSNLALVHVVTPRSRSLPNSPITLAVEVFDAAGHAAAPISVELAPGEWRQLNEVLALAGLPAGSADGGYARIRRTVGTGRFVAYGVVNDQRTADGSLVAMSKAGRLKASDTLLVPIVLEAGGLAGSFFTSELVLATRSERDGTATLRYVPSPVFSGTASGSVTIPLPARAQIVLPDILQVLRDSGIAIPKGSSQGGALFVTFQGLAPDDDVYAGSRTATPNPDRSEGGAFGVFLPGVETAALATTSALVPALRRDGAVRANLAVVNAGSGPIALSVSLRSAAGGAAIGRPLAVTLGAGEWYQWSNVFDKAGLGEGEAYAIVTRTSGDAPWYAYGVLNDERTSDGSVVAGLPR